MRCPHCNNENRPIKTEYTFHRKDGTTRRKKVCTKCKKRFYTIEKGYMHQMVDETSKPNNQNPS